MILKAFKFDVGQLEVNCFVYACEVTREALLVDVGDWSEAIADFVRQENLSVKTIFATHSHHDHVGGVQQAVKAFGAQVVAGTPDIAGRKVNRVVKHGDELTVGRHVGRIVDTSGHTPVGLCLIFPGIVFSGDALFAGSVGGTSNPADYEKQNKLIEEHLFSLPGHYEVHVGHGPSTTIEIERSHNPFFV